MVVYILCKYLAPAFGQVHESDDQDATRTGRGSSHDRPEPRQEMRRPGEKHHQRLANGGKHPEERTRQCEAGARPDVGRRRLWDRDNQHKGDDK